MREFHIRLAEMTDLNDCVWFDNQDAIRPVSGQLKQQMIRSRIENGNILLAVDSTDQPVGYLRVDRLWPKMIPALGWIYVKADWRQHGVMVALYQRSIEMMSEQGQTRFLMNTQSNRPDIMDLFKSVGMREVGRLDIHGSPDCQEVFFLCDI